MNRWLLAKQLLLSVVSVFVMTAAVVPQGVSAIGGDSPACPAGNTTQGNCSVSDKKNDCKNGLTKDKCSITNIIIIFTNAVSGLAGVAVVGSIIWAGIQYSASGSDPGAAAAARTRIRNSIIALVLYIFGYSFLNWVVPGGLL